jgi:hypothetical protein
MCYECGGLLKCECEKKEAAASSIAAVLPLPLPLPSSSSSLSSSSLSSSAAKPVPEVKCTRELKASCPCGSGAGWCCDFACKLHSKSCPACGKKFYDFENPNKPKSPSKKRKQAAPKASSSSSSSSSSSAAVKSAVPEAKEAKAPALAPLPKEIAEERMRNLFHALHLLDLAPDDEDREAMEECYLCPGCLHVFGMVRESSGAPGPLIEAHNKLLDQEVQDCLNGVLCTDCNNIVNLPKQQVKEAKSEEPKRKKAKKEKPVIPVGYFVTFSCGTDTHSWLVLESRPGWVRLEKGGAYTLRNNGLWWHEGEKTPRAARGVDAGEHFSWDTEDRTKLDECF